MLHSSKMLPIISSLSTPVKVSFEFFPPKTEKMNESLWNSIKRLEFLKPDFVSVTYGAGGATRERTHDTVVRIKKETSLEPAAHLTCVDASRKEIDKIIHEYKNTGIKHIVALRGDAPENSGKYTPRSDGYAYAVDLIKGIKRIGDFDISVAAYPETHPDAPSADFDMDNLKRKIDAGASRAITQFFFDMDIYHRFMDRIDKAGITIPVIPGILPVTNFKQIVGFANRSNTTIPKWMHELFDGLDDDPITRKLIAATVAIEQCRTLASDGIRDFHFYTLNRADLVYAICHVLGVRP
ncbi:MAG: methylenetetrahydrofolate reductase [Alphaproteobacteria bacterium]|nr:methylenetetrahydrofolate reductase [Alphaproteobacteria bacterium]